ncbi:MAG: ABC transporter substrate-binding protein [Anaerolineae bacterium]|nr:ABC transporter substrate-binding protein [Anaerolineae bacterium]
MRKNISFKRRWALISVALIVVMLLGIVGQRATAQDAVTIRFWMQQDNLLQAAMKDLIDSFQQANPAIKVQLEAFPFAEYHQKLSTAFAGNDAPDVFWMDVRTASLAQQGALMPLDEYITKENRADYLESTWIEPTYQGKTYGVPLHQLTEALYVNTKLAEAAGITLPKAVADAWTWQQFTDAAKKLTQRSGDQVTVWGFGVQRQLQDWSVLPVVYQHGGKTLSDDLKKATGFLNSKETVEALTWYGNLFTKDKVISVEVVPNGFQSGKIAILQAPSTFRPVLDKQFPDLKYTIIPMFKDKNCSVMTGGWNMSMSATTTHVKEAWALIDYLTREKHADWVEKSGYLPARKSLIEKAAKFKEYPWGVFMEQLQNCPATRPATDKYTFYFDTFKKAITDIAVGQDPQSTLDTAAKTLDAELSK